MVEESHRSRVSEQIARMATEASHYNSAARAMQDAIAASADRAAEAFRAAAIGPAFERVMKTYENAHRLWRVPEDLLKNVGALQALRDQLGRLNLPVIDAPSAATLAKILGPEGITSQLEKLGISSVPESKEPSPPVEAGIGLSRRNLELMTLLGFILAILVPLYQEFSSRDWQDRTDKRLDAQTALLKDQAKQLEALSALVQRAVLEEAQRRQTRFVVLDRTATIRSKPGHGASVTGKLLPREVVRPVGESGKWIEVEYYHWLRQEYETGWALKKYFTRVPDTYQAPASAAKR